MDLAIARLRKSQDTLWLKIEQYLKLKRFEPFKDNYKLNFDSLYEVEESL
jgi:hypothetical protein